MTIGSHSIAFPWVDPYGSPYGMSYSRVWNGTDRTPAEKAAGEYPPHPYTTTRTLENLTLTQWRTGGGRWYTQSSSWAGKPAVPADPFTANENNALINKLYAKVKGSEFNLAVSSAQLNLTVKMIGDTALKIARAYTQARRGKFRDASVTLTGRPTGPSNKVASNWLELQYGWKPLLKDVHDGAEWIASKVRNQPPKTVRVRKNLVKIANEPAHKLWRFGSVERKRRVQIIAILDQKLTFSQDSGLSDPFSVAWELVPYSFVIDWFLPVGDFLQAAAAARQLKGTFLRTEIDEFSVRGLYSGTVYTVLDGDAHRYKSFSMTRTLSSDLRPTLPVFKPLAKALSLHHTLNALALLRTIKR